jgi:hypothetical protein
MSPTCRLRRVVNVPLSISRPSDMQRRSRCSIWECLNPAATSAESRVDDMGDVFPRSGTFASLAQAREVVYV